MSVMGGNSIANMVSVTPGGVGVNQATNVAALGDVTDAATATAYSLGQQLAVTAWNIVFAVALVIWAFGWAGGRGSSSSPTPTPRSRSQSRRNSAPRCVRQSARLAMGAFPGSAAAATPPLPTTPSSTRTSWSSRAPQGSGRARCSASPAAALGAVYASLSARGSEFGRMYPWGVVRSLFAPPSPSLKPSAPTCSTTRPRWRTSAGVPPAHRAGHRDADALGAALHGLYWALANLALSKRLLVVVDDAHWADGPSLRWLEYLAASIDDLPVLLCVGLDPAYMTATRSSCSRCPRRPRRWHDAALCHRHRTARRATSRAPEPWDGLGAACHADTGGNPFLLHAVLDELCDRGGDVRADRLGELESEAISRAIDRRLARLPPQARDLAASVAIWGGKSRLHQAAALAGIDDGRRGARGGRPDRRRARTAR